nr:S53 family peptidase [Kofleriaceae bacterium]
MLSSCAVGDRDDSTDSSDDSVPTTGACSGGRFQCFAQIQTDGDTGGIRSFATPSGLTPANLAAAYALSSSKAPSATIAIVDAYGYSAAESDLAKYRTQYGLPACTTANGCFKKVNQSGKTSPLPSKPPAGDDWTVEAALDLDMASAACPSCKLILVEADDDQGDGLYIAQNGAASLNPAVISNSWGGGEDGTSFETYFTHSGINIFASSGDDGNTGKSPQYPSTSPHVTAVGGTSLKKSTTASRGWTETAWSDAGSSCSTTFAKPSWQNVTTGCTKRAASDISAVANPSTGLAVYNAANGGWIVVGGTSASSPFVAGVFARYGLGGETPSWAYSHTTDFFDVTSGKNGSCSSALCKAAKGWDGPTGIGTPNGAKL